jgi:methionine-S-sulfoxide reductase
MAIVLFLASVIPAVAFSAEHHQQNPSGKTMTTQHAAVADTKNLQDIYYAGGCFWGVEEYFSRIPGVRDVTSGYANGKTENPSYEEVCSERTGHAETVHVRYDPDVVSVKTLTEYFFKIINPVSVNRQGNDMGVQYRTGIYYVRESDKSVLEAVMREVQKNYSAPLAVELLPLANYYPAEDYHQDYLKKESSRVLSY